MSDFIKPEIGMGCTVHIGSDRYAYTVTAVFEIKHGYDVQIQADKTTPAEGHDYYVSQKYTYERNHKGSVMLFRYSTNLGCRWREIAKKTTGRYAFTDGTYRLSMGERDHYSDPGF